MAKVDIAIDKIKQIIDSAIEERDFMKMMETHDFIEGYVEKDRFRSFLKFDKDDDPVLNFKSSRTFFISSRLRVII